MFTRVCVVMCTFVYWASMITIVIFCLVYDDLDVFPSFSLVEKQQGILETTLFRLCWYFGAPWGFDKILDENFAF